MSANAELKKKTSRRTTWTPAEENILLDLWEENIEDLRGSRKNSHIYQEMASKLQEAGFDGSWSDVRTKIDNLTRKYKEERKKIGPTGGAPSSWVYYNKIHGIIGSFRAVSGYENMHESSDMSSLLDDSIIDDTIIEVDVASCSRLVGADCPPPKKRKVEEEMLQLVRERNAMQERHFTHLMTTLDTIASQNASFQKEIIEILREK